MQIQIALPDDVAHSLKVKWGSIERKLIEMLAVAGYQEGTISAGKVREMLEMSTCLEVDTFLKEKGVYLHYDEADLEADRQTHEQLRQAGKLSIP